MFTFGDLLLASWLFLHFLITFFILLCSPVSLMLLSCFGQQVVLCEDFMGVYEAGYSYMGGPCRSSSFVDIFFH
jgi:hypothetical protein